MGLGWHVWKKCEVFRLKCLKTGGPKVDTWRHYVWVPGGLYPGGAVPFWRRRVCKAQKTPFFSVAVTQRPLFFLQLHVLSPKDPMIFYIFLSPNAKFRSPNAKFAHRMPNFAHRMPQIPILTTEPSYFCIFLSPNAKNHALTQWPLIFWACALTECPSLSERGPYTRIHFIFDCPPPRGLYFSVGTKNNIGKYIVI